MFSNEINILVHKEQHRDRLRKVEQQRLVRLARLQAGVTRPVHERLGCWFGVQMAKVGARLQAYAVPAARPSVRAADRS